MGTQISLLMQWRYIEKSLSDWFIQITRYGKLAYYTLTFRVSSYIAPDNNIILEDVLEYSRRNKSLVSNKNQIKGK